LRVLELERTTTFWLPTQRRLQGWSGLQSRRPSTSSRSKCSV